MTILKTKKIMKMSKNTLSQLALSLVALSLPVAAQEIPKITPADTSTDSAPTTEAEADVLQVPKVPKDLLEPEDNSDELGINEFTAPSIRLIFDDLDQLTPLPFEKTKHELPKRMPLSRSDLATEIGFLIADGFLAVQHGKLDQIEPLAQELAKYGRALGAGDRVNRHVSSILECAKANKIDQLKNELAATQKDVEKELVQLHDADLAHLISLGGWIRALECAAVGVNENFTEERANQIFREDVAEYYEISIGSLDPRLSRSEKYAQMRMICSGLKNTMTLAADQEPTEQQGKEILEQAQILAKLALKREE